MTELFKIFKGMPEIKLDKKKQKVVLIYAAGTVLLLILYFSLVFKPALAKLTETMPRVRKLRADIKAVRESLRLKGKLINKVDGLKKGLEGYENMLSRERELPMLLEKISDLARDSHVKILAISPFFTQVGSGKGGASQAVYQEVPITIRAEGGYHEVGVFISKLENSERYLQISDLKIQSNDGKPRGHNIDFVVYAYTFKGDE
ncbi:MAG: type 4a pilus biogenesis protein PilO [Candidatus Omnitrophota bacterium]